MNTFEITLDVDKHGNKESVNMRQGDIMGTTISARLRDHDAPMEGGEYTAYFCMTLPDRKTYYRTEATYADGVVSAVVDERYAAQTPGATNNAYFELWDGEELKYTTDSFVVRVKASAMEGEAAQSYDVRVEALMDDMRAIMEEENAAETERMAAEAERKEAESAREEAEALREETFAENETQRATTFSDNEAQRTSTFNANEQGRTDVFEDNEAERSATFSENEQERADTFATNETERAATFSANETERANTFEENETGRARTFAASEAERQAIFEDSFAPPTVTVEETSYGHVAHITWKDADGEHVSDMPTYDATSIVVTGDTMSIPVDHEGKCLESGTARFSFSGWVGNKRVPCTASLTLAPDARYTVQLTNATATSEGLIRVSYTAGQQYPNAENVCTISLSCNGKSYVHRVSSIAPKGGRPVTVLDVSSDNVIVRLDGNGNTYAGTHLVRITPACGDTRLPITNVAFSGPSWITAQPQGVTVVRTDDNGNSVTTNYATGAILLSWTEGNSYTASGDLMTCSVEISYKDDGTTYTENRPIYFQGVRDGAVGPIGPQGEEGEQGEVGPQGERGEQGERYMLKSTVTDNPSTMTDSFSAPPLDMTFGGVSTQVQTTGKNLLDFSQYDWRESTYVKGTGAYGSSTANDAIIDFIPCGFIAGATVSVAPHTTAANNNVLHFYKTASQETGNYLGGIQDTGVVPENAQYMRVVLRKELDKGALQVELGSTATSYEPYTGGNPSPSPDYPQPIESVDELTLMFAGRNLLDPSTLSNGYITNDGSVYGSSDTYKHNDYLPVTPGVTYRISQGGTAFNAIRTAFYDKEKQFISAGSQNNSNAPTFTAPSNAAYMRSSFNGAQAAEAMIEVASDTWGGFEPYAGTTTPIDLQGHQLRSLPDGTRDELTIDASGNVTLVQRVGSIDLGTLTPVAVSGTSPVWYLQISDAATGATNVDSCMCTGYQHVASHTNSSAMASDAADNICEIQRGFSRILIKDTDLIGASVADVTAAINGMTAIYPLATPVTHDLGTITLPNLPDGDATVFATGGSATPSMQLTYERNLPQIIAQLVLEQIPTAEGVGF